MQKRIVGGIKGYERKKQQLVVRKYEEGVEPKVIVKESGPRWTTLNFGSFFMSLSEDGTLEVTNTTCPDIRGPDGSLISMNEGGENGYRVIINLGSLGLDFQDPDTSLVVRPRANYPGRVVISGQ